VTDPQTLDLRQLRGVFVRAWRSLSLIVAVIAIRSGAQVVLIIFFPLYEHLLGHTAQLGSYYAFTLSLSGAAGGLVGGALSDRLGRRNVSTVSLLMSGPLLALVLLANQVWIWPLLVLSGATLLASNSITVVQGQELLPTNAGIASGLTLGLGFGLSGVASTTLTALSDHIGVAGAIWVVPAMPVIAALLAWLVPETHRARRPTRLRPA
jgi:FSR family fosmidomycin resistance protein-like MFS transporter